MGIWEASRPRLSKLDRSTGVLPDLPRLRPGLVEQEYETIANTLGFKLS
jgi:hypothetical protein